MNAALIAILVIIFLLLGGLVVAFAGWFAFVLIPILLAVLVVAGARRVSRGAAEAAPEADAPHPLDAPPPAQRGDLSTGGGVQG